MSIVEAQDEVRLFGANLQQSVAVPLREVPDISRFKVVRSGLAIRGDDRCPNLSGDYIRPFGSDGVPMQLANPSRFQTHRNSRDAFRDREFLDGRFLCGSRFADPALCGLQVELKIIKRLVLPRSLTDLIILLLPGAELGPSHHGCTESSERGRPDHFSARHTLPGRFRTHHGTSRSED